MTNLLDYFKKPFKPKVNKMTAFTKNDIKDLIQCPICKMYSNLGFCWKCEPHKLTSEKKSE